MNIVPVHCGSDTGFQVTAGALQAAYDEAVASGARVRGVVLTNPSNPLGTTIGRAVLEDIVDFAARNDLHLISDEIYSGSVFAAPELVSVADAALDDLRHADQLRRSSRAASAAATAAASRRACTSSTASPRTSGSRGSASAW